MKYIYLLYLFFYFIVAIIRSGGQVTWLIMNGSRGENGGKIEYETRIRPSIHLVLFFVLISMTPGALSVDISDDSRLIQIHLLDVGEKDKFLKTASRVERLLISARL